MDKEFRLSYNILPWEFPRSASQDSNDEIHVNSGTCRKWYIQLNKKLRFMLCNTVVT